MIIKVFTRNVYGNLLTYPICDKALEFARLLKKKTFTKNELGSIRKLGFSVRIEFDPDLNVK